jgi:NADH-quinone oxidoreductase subunit F
MATKRIVGLDCLKEIKQNYLEQQQKAKWEILVCGGGGCVSSNCQEVVNALEESLSAHNIADDVRVTVTGCMGLCAVGPVMLVLTDNTFYTEMDARKVEDVVARHILGGKVCEEYTFYDPIREEYIPKIQDIKFFADQTRIVLRNCGLMDHASIDAYISRDGYFSIAKALEMEQQDVINVVKESGLRGRGGAGFPTGIKWEAGLNAHSENGNKYVVCNADEGDPGAFMDRSVLEGDPHSVIEGMLIGGYAIGASRGFVYLRAEYPLAIERLSNAIDQARKVGLLGENILGTGFNFDLEIRMGAGAFVCGEETSLLNSIEGKRGEPNQKPPYPFESGLYGCPTIINNVETLANIPPIVLNGAKWFRSFGTEKSAGTKVFALAGDIVNAGIIEVPLGIPLGDIIFQLGGGITGGKKFKAIQSGGPSGGCLTNEHLNTPVDYESLSRLGAIMGSGGLVVMDEDACMVDTARYFLDFIKDESCGKCLPCRVGTMRMLGILEKITEGNGEEGDIELLEELASTIKESAMCGLGQTAANPVLSTLRYFRDEYETHIHDKHCPAGVCANLMTAPCINACPAHVNVPGYLSLLSAGYINEAYQLIRQENPFPAVCGRICTHPCEFHCRRSQVDDPLAIRDLKRFIGDYALRDEYSIPLVESRPPTGKRVSIIGSGPSGLTCAYYLAHMGHDVHVYEAESVAGGVIYWGIPEFRLPKEVLAKEIKAIEAAGVKIHLNYKVDKGIVFDRIRLNSDAVYVAVGTQASPLLGVPNESVQGVESGLSFLRRVGLNIDRSVPHKMVVVGGGSTALDVARTALRLGSEEVIVLYRRTEAEMPAHREEIVEAKEEGVKIIELAAPVSIIDKDGKVSGIKCVRCELTDYGKDGRKRVRQIEGSEFEIECDGVITAINQVMDKNFFGQDALVFSESGELVINRFTSETSARGIFAGGDANPYAPNVVIYAIADGKRAAINIDKYLGGTGELNKGEEIDIPVIEDIEVLEPHPRFPVRELKPKDRIDNFCEVSLGYHKLDAKAEALRCLHCDRRV